MLSVNIKKYFIYLKLSTTTSVDCGWAECLPDNSFTNIGGDKQRNTGAKSIALL